MNPRIGTGILIATMLLAGCQRTLFEAAPAAATGCEALVGDWLSLGDGQGRDGEIEVTVSAECIARIIEHGAEGPRSYLPLRLHVASEPTRWIWVDATEANAALAVQPGPLERRGSVYVFAWTLRDDVLALTPPAHRALAHRVLDGDIDGAVHAEDRALTVRIELDAAATASLLSTDGTLDAGNTVRFRRATVASP